MTAVSKMIDVYGTIIIIHVYKYAAIVSLTIYYCQMDFGKSGDY